MAGGVAVFLVVVVVVVVGAVAVASVDFWALAVFLLENGCCHHKSS